jgi:hypothetical protein
MKRLLALVLLLCGSALAQSYHVYDVVWLGSGKPSPHSPIRVCSAGATGTPCSPLAGVFSDQALTQPVTQPIFTDSLGNYDFWVVSPASYVVEYYPQGSPVAVHQILTAPVTSPTAGIPGAPGTDGAPGAPGYSPSQILAGCGVGYTGGLTFTVGNCKYLIANSQGGQTFNITTNTALTGPAADPSLNRIDAIVASSAGTLSIVSGTPSANPGPPSLDPTSQLMVWFYEVDAGATTPANINLLDIYHENAEWTCAVSAHLNCASTVNPHTGTKDVEATAAVPTNFARFTIPAGTVDTADYNDLIFNIASKANWNGLSLTIQLYNGTTAKCTPVTFFNGQFTFNSALTTYQQIDVPLRLFNCNGIPITRIQFTVAGTGTSLGFYLDDIYLQGGATNSVGADFMKWQRAWSATKQYKINDTVTYNGTSYTAVADSVNAAPSANPLIWDGHDTHQPAGVDGNIQIKAGNTFAPINTSVSGNDVTFPGKIIAGEFDSTAVTGQGIFIDPVVTPTLSSTGGISFQSNAGACELSQNGGAYVACSSAFGGGTVTTFSSGNAAPLFTTSVANAGTTPALSFTISNSAAHTFYGNNTGSTAAPSFVQIAFTDLSGSMTCAQNPAGTGDVTNSAGSCANTIAANAVSSAKLAVVNTRRTCMIQVGDGTTTVVSGDYSPFKTGACYVPYAATVVEINIQSDAGTPSVVLERRRGAATLADLLSGALASAGTTHTCALAGISGTCIDGTTSSGTITLSNTSLNAGDMIEVKSGTASTETSMRIAVVFTVN